MSEGHNKGSVSGLTFAFVSVKGAQRTLLTRVKQGHYNCTDVNKIRETKSGSEMMESFRNSVKGRGRCV